MGEKRADKAPEKTAEGLRRVGVVLYDVDPEQLACITCGQQWQPTSLRGHWWQCPNGCTHRRPTRVHLHNCEPTSYV